MTLCTCEYMQYIGLFTYHTPVNVFHTAPFLPFKLRFILISVRIYRGGWKSTQYVVSLNGASSRFCNANLSFIYIDITTHSLIWSYFFFTISTWSAHRKVAWVEGNLFFSSQYREHNDCEIYCQIKSEPRSDTCRMMHLVIRHQSYSACWWSHHFPYPIRHKVLLY